MAIYLDEAQVSELLDMPSCIGVLEEAFRDKAEGEASEPGDVRCGIPGYDHPGTELHGDALRSTDPALRWEVRGRRNAAFATDFDYRSDG